MAKTNDMKDELQHHQSEVQKICRICGEVILYRKGYVNAKNVNCYKELLLMAYNIDSDAEPSSWYPKLLCSGCARKLDRLKKKDDLLIETFYPSHHFLPHHTNCALCIKKLTSKINLCDFDNVMKACGFHRIVVSDLNPKVIRIFGIQTLIGENLINKIVFQLFHDFSWQCSVYNNIVNVSLSEVPKLLSSLDDLEVLKSFFTENEVCNGIENFEDVIDYRLDFYPPFKAAYIEDSKHYKLQPRDQYKFVRANDCQFFKKLGKNLCDSCTAYSKNKLHNIRNRIKAGFKRGSTESSSHTNYRYLSHDEKNERLSKLHTEKRNLARKMAYWTTKISEQISDNGVVLNNNQQTGLSKILADTANDDSVFDETSPQWLLWQQQKLAASKGDGKGMRWHPLVLRFVVLK